MLASRRASPAAGVPGQAELADSVCEPGVTGGFLPVGYLRADSVKVVKDRVDGVVAERQPQRGLPGVERGKLCVSSAEHRGIRGDHARRRGADAEAARHVRDRRDLVSL
jgi:hypothetical protein